MPLKLKMAVLKSIMEKEGHAFSNCHTTRPSAKMSIWNVYVCVCVCAWMCMLCVCLCVCSGGAVNKWMNPHMYTMASGNIKMGKRTREFRGWGRGGGCLFHRGYPLSIIQVLCWVKEDRSHVTIHGKRGPGPGNFQGSGPEVRVCPGTGCYTQLTNHRTLH